MSVDERQLTENLWNSDGDDLPFEYAPELKGIVAPKRPAFRA